MEHPEEAASRLDESIDSAGDEIVVKALCVSSGHLSVSELKGTSAASSDQPRALSQMDWTLRFVKKN